MLQFGDRDPALDYMARPTAFGLVFHDGKLACVRVDRGAASYYDLPGGAIDGGMAVRPVARIAEAAQYFRQSDGAPINNIGGFWIAEQLSLDPAARVEPDHELVWLHPHTALNELRHDAHAWAVAVWLRRK